MISYAALTVKVLLQFLHLVTQIVYQPLPSEDQKPTFHCPTLSKDSQAPMKLQILGTQSGSSLLTLLVRDSKKVTKSAFPFNERLLRRQIVAPGFTVLGLCKAM